jgi:hypothetical protein
MASSCPVIDDSRSARLARIAQEVAGGSRHVGLSDTHGAAEAAL